MRDFKLALINYFPKELPSPRPRQTEVLDFCEASFKNGIKTICVDAPVGIGKSGVAITLSRAFGGGIVAMPKIDLQNQYLREFDNCYPLVGRARFPCLKLDSKAKDSYAYIERGELPPKPQLEFSCASAPCLNRPRAKMLEIRDSCDAIGGCPHQKMLDKAQESETIISNLHSLLYSVSLNDRIAKRKILIIDEAHNLFKFIQDFSKVNFFVRRRVHQHEVQHLTTTEQWYQWLSLSEQMATLTKEDSRDSYLARLEKLKALRETVQTHSFDQHTGYLRVTLTPVNVGALAQALLFSLSDKVVLLSGTILSKTLFTRPLSIDPDTTAYIQIESDFPVKNRPVYLPSSEQTLDLSFKHLDSNLPRCAKIVNEIIDKYPDKKGIIHTNSYSAASKLFPLLNKRVMCHTSENFTQQLEQFRLSSNSILMSPVISEGYDFKDDHARFNIILSPSYEPINDSYVKWMLNKDMWNMYNYNAVKVLLQQLGRGVRHKNDQCDNYLIDSRFINFVSKVKSLIPKWQLAAFQNKHP